MTRYLTPLDLVLGTRSRIRLLRVLHARTAPLSGREAARLAGLSHHGVQALDELAGTGIVVRREAAGQNLYTFNEKHVLADAVRGLFDAESRQAGLLTERLSRILKTTGGVVAAAVFGSAARGEASPDSDLDLLVLVEEEESVGPLHDALSSAAPALRESFGVRLSPVVLTVRRARRQRDEGPGFLDEAIGDARRVYGPPLHDVLGG